MIWLAFLRSNWRLIVILAVAAVLGGYILTLRIERDHARTKAENIQTAFDQFQAKVRVEGEAQKLRVAEEVAASERAKNETVATLQARLNTVARDRDRLRDSRAASGGSVLPALPPGPAGIDKRACFDRGLLDEALGRFIDGVTFLVAEGDGGITVRDAWLRWFRGQVEAAGKN